MTEELQDDLIICDDPYVERIHNEEKEALLKWFTERIESLQYKNITYVKGKNLKNDYGD